MIVKAKVKQRLDVWFTRKFDSSMWEVVPDSIVHLTDYADVQAAVEVEGQGLFRISAGDCDLLKTQDTFNVRIFNDSTAATLFQIS
jgi:hypothetical protein